MEYSFLRAANVTLAWDPPPETGIAGYNLYYGQVSRGYTAMMPATSSTAIVSNLVDGTTYYFAVTTRRTSGQESDYSTEIIHTVPTSTANLPPAISRIPNQSVNVDAATPALPFTIGDSQTPASNLIVSATCSNPTLVPVNQIVLGGTGTNRTVTVRPAAGQSGVATIALTVCDPSLCATISFVLTVNPANPPPAVTLISPANGATYASPASITMTASVTANGHTITSIRFYNGSTLLGQTTSAPYNYTWNAPPGSHSLTVQAIYDSGASVVSPPASVSVQGLPAPWQTLDIGSVGVAGSAEILNERYTVQGAGTLGGSADKFRFLYQGLSGDGEIRTKLSTVQNSGNNGRTGVMVRESLTSGSRNAFMGMAPGGSFRWQRRTSTGGSTSSTKSGAATPPAAWVRLVRTGNRLDGYKSTNGTNWTLVDSATITMAPNIYIGLTVASGSSTTLSTSVFTNTTVVP